MSRKHKNNNFTLGPKRKLSRAEVRRRQAQAAPVLTCEQCGEGEELKQIMTTRRGEILLCYDCRRAHGMEMRRMGGLL